jgi:hypothetical protein
MWATSISLREVERRALPIEETRDAPAAQEAHGLELLDRGVHRIEAVGMQFEGADRTDAGDEEQETPVRLHWRCWYSRQASGSQSPPLSSRIMVLRPPKRRIVRRPVASTGTGAWHMQWRTRPSAEYCDQ